MENLNEVDTKGIAPTYHALPTTSSLIEDSVEGSLARKEAMVNAPQKDGNFFSTLDAPTTCGSRILKNYLPAYDAAAIKRLRG
jgi:Asp-tRNA(Asn)/Glu-tRNA(Gln) amidotransferase A subunit family amidase